MGTISYTFDMDEVNWQEMRETLIADDFHNGRTVEQYEDSFRHSAAAVVAHAEGRIVGTARALSDGICNAYIVDVWTLSAYRRQGIARTMMDMLLARLPGQHVFLFTDDAAPFYERIGFARRGVGYEVVVGRWLVNDGKGGGFG